MNQGESDNSKVTCAICRRAELEWFVKMTIEDTSGFSQEAFICANCGVKLRLASEKARDLQIDPWVHEAFARVLRGKEPLKED
jgi:hypothetical protein